MPSAKILQGFQTPASDRTIARLSHYRRMVGIVVSQGRSSVYSHDIANWAGVTPAQVRRDLMSIGYEGSPKRGYDSRKLLTSIESFLYEPDGQNVALVGVGNLGRAILAYFACRRRLLRIVAAFDRDAAKVSRTVHGCRCYRLARLREVVRRKRIDVGIVSVPASAAQDIADRLVEAGATGILNFAPVSLRLPPYVYVGNIDLAMALEKVAFFSRQSRKQPAGNGPHRAAPTPHPGKQST
jgi:redox-sensing transcriptional repressor